MSNNDSIIIQPSGEVISQTALQSNLIVFGEEKRQKVIQILRQIPPILDSAKKLPGEKVYQAYFPPEVWERLKDGSVRLDKKDDGLFGVVIRDAQTGRIADQVSLKEVTPDCVSSLNQLAIQQTLTDIVHRLEAIDEKITDILQGQVNDRLAEIESGIDMYEQAMLASDPNLRRNFLGNAIQDLNRGRRKLIKSTDFSFVDKLPRNKWGMFFSGNMDISKFVLLKAESVGEAARAIIEASRYLVLAYSALNEPDSLRVSLEQVESEIKVFQDKIGEIVHWLPPKSNWHEGLVTISQDALPHIHDLDNISQKTIVVEFHPKEIAPPEEFDYETL